ncbi:MAG: hypothetical protein LUF00_10965 [Lachnospiraceae bacterium]|nr:hypothetical protein [Lachnospiraceae bacterium]
MMEYKRFVSYLYRYEGGQKERNAGFVRLEVRNSQCRIRIFLHHLPEMQTEGEAWMFRQEGERFQMVPLGRFTVQEGGVEVCLATRADSFLDTGLPVTAFRGLAVFLGAEERLYLTIWDDEPVNLAAIRRRGEEPEAEPEMEPEAEKETEKVEERGDPGETGTSFEVPSGKENISVDADASRAKEGNTVEKDEPSADLQRQSIERDFRIWWRQLLEAGAAVVEKYVGQRQAKLETAELSSDRQNALGVNLTGICGAQAASPLFPGVSQVERQRQRSPDHAPLPDSSPPDWAALCRQLPRFLPEGQTEQREFLRLSLQDIGRLPRAYWDFGKNAFVLYGFSLGNHLILLREKPSACFLGVPGRDLGEDRLAAEMFGFHRYIELGGQGYWLAGIKL